jgi:hypothetical protein
MAFPIRKCVICSEEFELKPDKPGFANRCPACSEANEEEIGKGPANEGGRDPERDEARRRVMRDLLYRKDS